MPFKSPDEPKLITSKCPHCKRSVGLQAGASWAHGCPQHPSSKPGRNHVVSIKVEE